MWKISSYLDYSGEVFSIEVVVCLQKYFTQPTLSNRIVFGIELVKAMECVTILQNTAMILSHFNNQLYFPSWYQKGSKPVYNRE